jgi:tyrosyl-tRNA synthetase
MDPTISDLHLGHTVVMQKLRQFQDLGHQAIFLIGDYTAQIGDPSGRSETRRMLTHAEVMDNAQTYLNQAFKILDRDRTEVRYNSEWLGKMTSLDFAALGSKYTVARALERDDFKKRFEAGENISILEFYYPLLQAQDSVALEADVELGGADQVFNLLVARTIQKRSDQEQQVVLTMPLLVGTDGVQKMSKTYGNYIGITDAPEDMFGKIMSVSDDLMWNYYELLSTMSMAEIKERRDAVDSNEMHPKIAKEALAMEIVARYYDEDAAREAKAHFDQVIVGKGRPENIDEFVEKTATFPLVDAMVKFGSIKSKSEAKRLISQNAVTVNDEKIEDVFYCLPKGKHHIKVGKRNHFIVKIMN